MNNLEENNSRNIIGDPEISELEFYSTMPEDDNNSKADDTSEENHEGVIWLALKEANKLDLSEISTYPECVERFSKKNAPDQKTFEIIHRHGLEDGDTFKMKEGYENFQKIEKGELLAIQNDEEIKSDWNARIFMPLYQAQGNDGFFVVEEVETDY